MGRLAGSLTERHVLAVNAGYALTIADHQRILDVTASGSDVTITLPAASSIPNGFYVLIRRNAASSTNVVVGAPVSRTLSSAGAVCELACDGGAWQELARGSGAADAHASSHHSGGSDALAHQSIAGAGTNTHAQVDAHIGDASIHGDSSSVRETVVCTHSFAAGDVVYKTGLIGAPSNLNQTSRVWNGIAGRSNGDVYACVFEGDIYKQTGGTGDFVALGQTSREWAGIACHSNGNVYAHDYGDVYLQTNGAGTFNLLQELATTLSGISCHKNGDVYLSKYTGDIYKQTNGSGSFTGLGQTNRYWNGIACHPNGDVYAVVFNGDIYKQTNGTGDFVALSQASNTWRGIFCHPNGDVYATNGVDIYKQTNGTGNFVATGQTSRNWRALGVNAQGHLYIAVYDWPTGGDLYKWTGGWGKAKADAVATAEAVGVIESVSTTVSFVVVYSGKIAIAGSSWADGAAYYLSAATAGLLTRTEPSTGGYVSKPVLIATGMTTGVVVQYRGMSTLASNGILYGNGTAAVQSLAVNSTATPKYLAQVSSGAPAWVVPIGNAPSFSATQTSGQSLTAAAGWTKITWTEGTDSWDTDGTFDSSSFTPTRAGKYRLSAMVQLNGTTAGNEYQIAIYKNGSILWKVYYVAAGSNLGLHITALVSADGDDYFDVVCYVQTNCSLSTGAQANNFCGEWVGVS
jgi:hypothetical protein